jgi:hypothetical protein
MEQHQDTVRRVVQCVCGAMAHYRGDEHVRALGWGSWWEFGGDAPPRRIWRCPECWSPPRLSLTPIFMVPPTVLAVAGLRRDSRRRRSLERLIGQLVIVEAARARAYLEAIVVEMGRSTSAEFWRELLGTVGQGD